MLQKPVYRTIYSLRCRDVGAEAIQPFQRREALNCFAVFDCIDDPLLVIQVLHPFPGE